MNASYRWLRDFVEFDLSLVDEVRKRIPALAHRRPIGAAVVQ